VVAPPSRSNWQSFLFFFFAFPNFFFYDIFNFSLSSPNKLFFFFDEMFFCPGFFLSAKDGKFKALSLSVAFTTRPSGNERLFPFFFFFDFLPSVVRSRVPVCKFPGGPLPPLSIVLPCPFQKSSSNHPSSVLTPFGPIFSSRLPPLFFQPRKTSFPEGGDPNGIALPSKSQGKFLRGSLGKRSPAASAVPPPCCKKVSLGRRSFPVPLLEGVAPTSLRNPLFSLYTPVGIGFSPSFPIGAFLPAR